MASSPNHIAVLDTFTADSVARQLYVFQASTYKTAFIEIHSDRYEKIIEQIINICEGRLVNNAGTVALNEIGKQLNMTRYSDDDEVYRTAILMRQQSSTSSTTKTNLVELLENVFELDADSVFVTNWSGRVDIILLDVCITSTAAIQEIKRLLPILSRYTIGTKSNGTLLGLGSLQEFSSSLSSDEEMYTLTSSGTLGSIQIYEENGSGAYRDDTWGYPYQIEEEIL